MEMWFNKSKMQYELDILKYKIQSMEYSYVSSILKTGQLPTEKQRNELQRNFIVKLMEYGCSSVSNGADSITVAKRLGMQLLCMVQNNSIFNNLSGEASSLYSELFKKLIEDNDKYKSYIDYVKNCSLNGYIPYIPETAALDLVLMEMTYYQNTRKRISNLVELATEHSEKRNDLFEIYQKDYLKDIEIINAEHKIIANIINRNPSYKRCFDDMYGIFGINTEDIEKKLITSNKKDSDKKKYVYSIPSGLFTFGDNKQYKNYILARPVLTLNKYNDIMYEIIKDSYNDIKKCADSNGVLDNDIKKVIHNVNAVKTLMTDDGYSNESITKLVKSVEKRCDVYNTYNSKSDIKEKYIKSDKDFTYKIQDTGHIKSFNGSLNEADYTQIVQCMNDFGIMLNPFDRSERKHYTVEEFKKDPEQAMETFLSENSEKSMSESERAAYEFILCTALTTAPVIDKQGHIVATRSTGHINVGDTGGIVRGTTVVESGAWIDSTSYARNSYIGSGVILSMQSVADNSNIKGSGIIANSRIVNCDISGNYDPKQMRKQLNMDAKAEELLEINDVRKEFIKKDKELQKDLFDEYMNKTVDIYVHQNDLYRRIKEEEEANTKAARQFIAHKTESYGYLGELSKKLGGIAKKTETKEDDKFAKSLKNKYGSELANDMSVTVGDIIDEFYSL